MTKFLGLVICASFVASAAAASEQEYFEKLKSAVLDQTFPASEYEPEPRQAYQTGLPGGFTCPALSASSSIPTDARKVRPSDIKAVAALGDSLTAGQGAKARYIWEVLTQWRGVSWSVGGDETLSTVLTVPNVLKQYNQYVRGFSTGIGVNSNATGAKYNVAEAGAEARDLLSQATVLFNRVKADGMLTNWKLVTILIGGNDICNSCKDPPTYTADAFKRNLQATLDYLQQNLPRTIVNMVGAMNMRIVTELANNLVCAGVHLGVCGCVYSHTDSNYPETLSRSYAQVTKDLLATGRYNGKSDFAVTYHPMLEELEPPRINGAVDMSYMAPDCFHWSQKGQEAAAVSLWNSMFTPPNNRGKNMEVVRSLICPTTSAPFITI